MCLCDIGCPFPAAIVVLYGCKGAESKQQGRELNALLFQAVEAEIGRAPEMPHIICGDFNCLPQSVEPFASMLERGT
eukprot:14293858-Alexandrium_andersonii.AAC.1